MAAATPPGQVLRILVLMEANDLTGPAKNLAAAIGLLEGKADFHVIAFIRGSRSSTEFIEQLRARGVEVAVIREKFRYDPRCLGAMRRIARAYRPDVVQIHNTKSRLYVYLLDRLGLLGKFARVDCHHGDTWTTKTQLAYNRIDRWLFRRARHIVVVSQRQKRALIEQSVDGRRITVIYNGIRLREPRRNERSGALRIITVGRLSYEKGHADLIESARLLRKRGAPEFRLTIVGDGPEMESLKHEVSESGLTEIVEFAGYQSDPGPYYESADLFVLPSLTEGIPNVLLEAALDNVPIVSTNVGGIPEMFADGSEIRLVPPGEPARLAGAILETLADGDGRSAQAAAARKVVEERFSDVSRAQQLLRFYRDLLEPSS